MSRGTVKLPGRWPGPASMVARMASVRQVQVTFVCTEPERVARFWCEVLGYVVPPPPEGFATWDEVDRALPPERLAALEAECSRLLALGAVRMRLLRADGFNESCLVMQDIEGNEFCLD